jgi:hypothetical protein
MNFVECEYISDYLLPNEGGSKLHIDLHQIQAVVIGRDHGVIYTSTRDRYYKIALKDAKRIVQELDILGKALAELDLKHD